MGKKDEEYEASAVEVFRLFLSTSLNHKKYFFIALLNPINSVITFVGIPLFASQAVAGIALQDGSFTRNMVYLCITAVTAITANRFGFIALMKLNANAIGDLTERSFSHLIRRSLSFHSNNVGGKIVTHGLDVENSYSTFVVPLFTTAASIFFTTTLGLIVVFTQSFALGIYLLLIVSVLLTWLYLDSKHRSSARANRYKAQKDVISHFSDSIVNAATVKTFAAEQRENKTQKGLVDKLTNLRIVDWVWAGTNGNRMAAFLIASVAGLLLLLNQTFQNNPEGAISTGVFTFSYMLTLILRLFVVTTLTRTMEEAVLKAKPMTRLFAQDLEIVDAKDAKKLFVDKGAISFTDVSFTYEEDDQSEAVFRKLQLDIKPGEKIGLVGPSGGGKTTFTRLLLRFDDIQDGEITIDGQNIAKVSQQSLRSSIGYVPQEPLLFHRSIRENIAYGKHGASDKEIEAAARHAHALEFINDLPKAMNTIVGERGVKLSGGQRQRVAIARAILKDAPILLLDEATSALDSESEQYVQESLDTLMKGKTSIVIAHRLSTIQKMDRIIVLDGGKIVEEGSHKQLIEKKNGLYARLWKHQSGGFLQDQ